MKKCKDAIVTKVRLIKTQGIIRFADVRDVSINMIDQFGYIFYLGRKSITFVFSDRGIFYTKASQLFDRISFALDTYKQQIVCREKFSFHYVTLGLKDLKIEKNKSYELQPSTEISLKELGHLIKTGAKFILQSYEWDDYFELTYIDDCSRLFTLHLKCPLMVGGPDGTLRKQLSNHLILLMDGRKSCLYRQMIYNLITGEKKLIKPDDLFRNQSYLVRCLTQGDKYFAGYVDKWYVLVEEGDFWHAHPIVGNGEYPIFCPIDGLKFIQNSKVELIIDNIDN